MKKNYIKYSKFIALFLVASFNICMMTGCMKSDTKINVSSAGSGTVTSKISIKKDSLIEYYKLISNTAGETISDDEIISTLKEEGFILETIDGVEYYTAPSSYSSDVSYSDIPGFYQNYGSSLMNSEDNDFFSLSETSIEAAMPKNSSLSDSLSLNMPTDSSDLDLSSEELKSATIQYSVTFDTEITNHSENTTLSEDKKTVSFTLPFIAQEDIFVYAYCENDISISNVKNGMIYKSGKTITLPKNVTATINNSKSTTSEIVCKDNGIYDIKLKDTSGTTETIYFTIDSTAPKFVNCKTGGYYKKLNDISVSDDFSKIKSFTIDGKEQISNSSLTNNENLLYTGTYITYYCNSLSNGKHKFTATDSLGNLASITVTIDNKAPVVKGVKNGKKYTKAVILKFSDNTGIKTAKLNGKKIKSGKKVTKKGSYTLIVTDKANNAKSVKFKIK